jgi:hypothetical protein
MDEESLGETGVVRLRNLPKDNSVRFTALPGMLVGQSSDGRFLYQGNLHDVQEQTINLRSYATPDAALANSWALFGAEENTFGLTSWYPAITIERLTFSPDKAAVTLEPDSRIHDNVARIFSFFEKASNGVKYQGDLYFLFKWKGTTIPLYSVLLLRADNFHVKGYTYPFAFQGDGIVDDAVCSGLEIIEEAGEANAVVVCGPTQNAAVDGMPTITGVVAKVSLLKVLAWLV